MLGLFEHRYEAWNYYKYNFSTFCGTTKDILYWLISCIF